MTAKQSSAKSSPWSYDQNTLALLRRLWHEYVHAYKGKIYLALFFMALSALSTAGLAKAMEPVIDDIFKSENMAMLHLVSMGVLGLFMVKGVSAYGEAVTMNFIGQRIIANIQQHLIRHLLSVDLAFFHHNPSGVLTSHCTNDVNLMRSVVANTITGLGKDLLTVIALVTVMFSKDWFLACITFFIFPIAVLPIVRIGKRLRKISSNTQQETGAFLAIIQQVFQGARLVKSYCREEFESRRIGETIEKLVALTIKSNRVKALSSPIMETLGGIAVVIVIMYGGTQVIHGENTAGEFFAFITALLFAYEPMKRLANLNANLQEGLAATARIFSIMDMEPTIQDTPKARDIPIQKGAVVFDKVSFAYDKDHPILHQISMTIPAGKTAALVGPSGAGKSTLLNLIPRFYDVTKGDLEIDGVSVKDYMLYSLRGNIALVSQEILLFDDTIHANIAYGNLSATQEEIEAAARHAAAHEFIKDLPKGYDTIVGESGIKLSGGQRQRISIARAILKNAPILLLDEATSSLDTESERHVQKALEELRKDRTCIVIAHRLSTVKNADIIFVMDQGKIVEQGTHTKLLAKKGLYADLCQWQLVRD